jgi:hypothetical protein
VTNTLAYCSEELAEPTQIRVNGEGSSEKVKKAQVLEVGLEEIALRFLKI